MLDRAPLPLISVLTDNPLLCMQNSPVRAFLFPDIAAAAAAFWAHTSTPRRWVFSWPDPLLAADRTK